MRKPKEPDLSEPTPSSTPQRSHRNVLAGLGSVQPISNVRLPANRVAPAIQILRRALVACALLAATVVVVYAERDGYHDSAGGPLSVLDALYYATVSLTTTGYGDITPVTPSARLVNVLVITPFRIGFLVVLVGTTLQVLATRSRQEWQLARWRRRLRNHTVVIGYGTKGRSAVETLVSGGVEPEQIVVVDPSPDAAHEANAHMLAGIVGDGSRADVLHLANVQTASRVIVTTNRDATSVLVTLTARQINPHVSIIATVRESENKPLLEQSGADVVVTSSEAVGRLVGLATVSPKLGTVLEDLLSYGEGLEVATRPILRAEVGKSPRELDDLVVAVVRDGQVYRYYDPTCSRLVKGDEVVVVRPAEELPWAPRPGSDADEPEPDAGPDAVADPSRE